MAAKEIDLLMSAEVPQPVPQLIPIDELPPLPLLPGGDGHA